MPNNIFLAFKFCHMRRTLYQLCIFTTALILGLYNSGCVAPYGFQTGRAMGEGKGELGIDLSYVGTQGAAIPLPNIAGRMGITDKMDIGMVIGLTSFPYAYARYQVLGDLYTPVALSIGAGGGYLGSFNNNSGTNLGAGYVHFPLYFSLHSNDFAWYLTPQYSVFFSSGSNASVISASTGIEYFVGRQVALGLNIGLTRPASSSAGNFSVFTAGLGAKFRFGN